MDISQDMIIDIALNLSGYLVAGLLGMVLYSAFSRKPKSQTAPVLNIQAAKIAKSSKGSDGEFIKLKNSSNRMESRVMRPEPASPAQLTTQQRNRVEVIRLAREMLKSGTSKERVQDLLPISDGEMALLIEN